VLTFGNTDVSKSLHFWLVASRKASSGMGFIEPLGTRPLCRNILSSYVLCATHGKGPQNLQIFFLPMASYLQIIWVGLSEQREDSPFHPEQRRRRNTAHLGRVCRDGGDTAWVLSVRQAGLGKAKPPKAPPSLAFPCRAE